MGFKTVPTLGTKIIVKVSLLAEVSLFERGVSIAVH